MPLVPVGMAWNSTDVPESNVYDTNCSKTDYLSPRADSSQCEYMKLVPKMPAVVWLYGCRYSGGGPAGFKIPLNLSVCFSVFIIVRAANLKKKPMVNRLLSGIQLNHS